MQSKSRLIHFDVLKGIAILLVIWGHVYNFGIGEYRDNMIYILLNALHMPLFIMLSGFFFTKPLNLSTSGILSFWRDKVIRLLLPLLLLPLLFNWVKYGFSVGLPLNMYLGEYWFTYTLFSIFIIFYLYRLILSFARERERESNPILTITLGLTIILALHFVSEWLQIHAPSWYHKLNLRQLDWLYKYFWLGYLIGKYPKLERIIRGEALTATLFLVFCGLLYVKCTFDAEILSENIPLTTTGLLALYSMVYQLTNSREGQITNVLAYLGKESLPIYLTHYFFVFDLSVLKPFLSSIQGATFGWDILIGSLSVIIILLPTLVTIRFIKSNTILTLLLYGEKPTRPIKQQPTDSPQ